MCQGILAHPGYTRTSYTKALKTKNECVLVGYYRKPEEPWSKEVFDALWTKDSVQKSLEDIIHIVEEEYQVQISVEELKRFKEPQKFEIPNISKVYLFITKKAV